MLLSSAYMDNQLLSQFNLFYLVYLDIESQVIL